MSTPSQPGPERTSAAPVKVAVVGAGQMGSTHIRALTHSVDGALVTAVVDADPERAREAAEVAGGASVFSTLDDALGNADIDAVIVATPGFVHEEPLLVAIGAGLPVLCEKPLTDQAVSSLRVVEAEMAAGRQLVQVGFMRRFDDEYARLREIIGSREYGPMLLFHAIHRVPDVSSLPNFTENLLILDAVVHEIDILRFLTGEEVAAVTVIKPRTSSLSAGLGDPQIVLVETTGGTIADIEINAHAQYGYEVAGEAVLESATFEHGRQRGLLRRHAGVAGHEISPGFPGRFGDAFRRELTAWVGAVKRGGHVGPSAWDGYAAQVAAEAGVAAQRDPGTKVAVSMPPTPDFYRQDS